MKKEDLLSKTLPANIDPKHRVEIRNADSYHVYAVKVIPNPADQKHPIIRPRLLVFRPVDYEKYFMCSGKDQIEYMKTMNYESAELVHDPTRNTPDVKAILKKIAEDDRVQNEKDLQRVTMIKSKVKAFN